MGVVMSLFQRSDDNQKFLVTLNGYNNNHVNEKNMSDDEERLEMEVASTCAQLTIPCIFLCYLTVYDRDFPCFLHR